MWGASSCYLKVGRCTIRKPKAVKNILLWIGVVAVSIIREKCSGIVVGPKRECVWPLAAQRFAIVRTTASKPATPADIVKAEGHEGFQRENRINWQPINPGRSCLKWSYI